MNPPWYAIPLAMPPIACSRTPNRRFRPGWSAEKSPPSLTSVRFDSERSAAPPNSSGSTFASALIAFWLAWRVASSSPPVSYGGSTSLQRDGSCPAIRRRNSAASSGNASA